MVQQVFYTQIHGEVRVNDEAVFFAKNFRSAAKVLITPILVLFWQGGFLFAQVHVFNKNVNLVLGEEAVFFIPGNYTNTSSDLDGVMTLGGEVVLLGDLNNLGPGSAIDGQRGNGTLTFAGPMDQQIVGNAMDVPNLKVDKPGGNLLLKATVKVIHSANFVRGRLRLADATLDLGTEGQIVNESGVNRIFGSGEVAIYTAAIPLNYTNASYHGIGLGLQTLARSFAGITIDRLHSPQYQIANGINITRSFRIANAGTTETLGALYFNYWDNSELNGLSETTLAAYITYNGGGSWEKLSSTPDPSNNRLIATDVVLAGDKDQIISLADAECSDSFKPSAAIAVSGTGNSIVSNVLKACANENITLTPSAYYYRWTLPGGQELVNQPLSIPSLNTSHDLALYTLYVRNERGCERTRTILIDVIPLPEAYFTHSPPNGTSCFGDEVEFNDASDAKEAGVVISAWSWVFEGNSSSSVQRPTHTFSSPGSYHVQLVVTNSYGCVSTNNVINDVIVNSLPSPQFSFVANGTASVSVCRDEEFQLNNESTYTDWGGNEASPASSAMSYRWEFQGGSVATEFEPSFTYGAAGTYTVKLIATDNTFGCKKSTTRAISIKPRPVAAFHFETEGDKNVQGSIEGICEGVTLRFANESKIEDNTPLSFLWTFGDGGTSTDENPARQYIQQDNYNVTLGVSSAVHGCSFSLSKALVVHPAPEGHFTMEVGGQPITDICASDHVRFVNESFIPGNTPLAYTWNFADGTTAASASPSHSFSSPAVHHVTLTRTSVKGCTNKVGRSLFVHAYPVADFVTGNVCDNTVVSFSDASTVQTGLITAYEWRFGDGATSAIQHPGHLYAGPGTYTVSLAVNTAYGCEAVATKNVTVYRNPRVDLGQAVLGCGGSLLLDPIDDASDYPSEGGTFTWKNRLGQTLATTETLEVTSSGTYYLTVTTEVPAGCEASYAVPAYVVTPRDLGPNRTACGSMELNAAPVAAPIAGSLTYRWTKNGTLLPDETARLVVTSSGSYEVTATYTLGELAGKPSCSYTDAVTINIEEPPLLNLGSDIRLCDGATVTLAAGVAADTYSWTHLNSGKVVGNSAVHVIDEGGEYRLDIVKGACSAFDIISVSTVTPPEVSFTSSASKDCLGNSLTLTNLSFSSDLNDQVSSYSWDFGDGTYSSEIDPVKTFESAGVFVITLTATSESGCSARFAQEITLNVVPSANFDAQNGCAGSEIAFHNQSTIDVAGALSFFWSFGDGTTSTLTSPTKIYNEPGTYEVSLKAKLADSKCEHIFSKPITVFPIPSGGFTIQDGEIEVTNACVAQTVSMINTLEISDGSPLEYLWSFGDSTYSYIKSPPKTFLSPGNYSITLKGFSTEGCETVTNRQIAVNVVPDAGFEAADICLGEPLLFHNASSIAEGKIEEYQWRFGDESSTNLYEPAYLFQNYGSYDVSLTAISAAGCSSQVTKQITVHRPPTVNFGELVLKCGDVAILDAYENPANYIPDETSFVWKNSSEQVVGVTEKLQVDKSGIYTVELTTNLLHQCKSELSLPVFIVKPAYLGPAQRICGETILDIAPSSFPPGGMFSYTWEKDGLPLMESGNQLRVSESGDYHANGVFTLNAFQSLFSCSFKDSVFIHVDDRFALNLGDTLTACLGEEMVLSAGVSADSYQWLNLTTSEVIGIDEYQSVSESGIYELTVSRGACSSKDAISVEFLPLPQVGFLAYETTACLGQVVRLEDISFPGYEKDRIVSREWHLGDGTYETLSSIEKIYSEAGRYQVALSVLTENGCKAVFEKEIAIDVPPNVSFDIGGHCEESEIEFTNTTTSALPQASYFWDFGDGQNAALESPVHQYLDPGMFQVSLKVSSGACTTVSVVDIEVNPKPTADLGAKISTCGSQILLDAGYDAVAQRWFDPLTDNTLSLARFFTVSSNQEVGLTVFTDKGCEHLDKTLVQLATEMSLDLGEDREVCGSAVLDAGAFPQGTYEWSTGDKERSLKVEKSGVYSVTVTDQNGCTARDEINIDVEREPFVELGNNVIVSADEGFVLDAKNDGARYLWSTGEVSQAIQIINTGIYEVIVSYGYCTASDSVEVTVLDDPSLDFVFTGSCENEVFSFSPVTEIGTQQYLWDFGDGTRSANQNASKKFGAYGTHNVTLTIRDENNLDFSITKSISVQPSPKPRFTNTVTCLDELVHFSDSSVFNGPGDLTYLWSFGDGSFSTSQNPVHIYSEEQEYLVSLRVSAQSSCSAVFVQALAVRGNPHIDLANYVETCETSIVLDAGNLGSDYFWSTGVQRKEITVERSGSYAVTVRDSWGCKSNSTVNVKLLESSVPNLGADRAVCGGTVLRANVVANAFIWSTGETGNEILADQSGGYWLETISKDLCLSRDEVALDIYPLPIFDLGPNIEACAGQVVNLSPQVDNAVSFQWSNGVDQRTISVTETGYYKAVFGTSEGCSFSDSLKVTFNALPVSPLESDYEACGKITLNALNNGSSFLWSTGQTTDQIDVLKSGEYWLKVTNIKGCSVLDSTSVIINNLTASLLEDKLHMCEGESVVLSTGIIGAQHLWSTNETTNSIEVDTGGVYSVSISKGSCKISNEVSVFVDLLPLVAFSTGTACEGRPVRFTTSEQNEDRPNYFWDFGDGTKSVKKEPTKVFSKAKDYTVNLSVTNSFGCYTSLSKAISVGATPSPNFLFENACEREGTIFSNITTASGEERYLWSFGDGRFSSEKSPVAVYEFPGTYSIQLTATNEALCSNSFSKPITVNASPRVFMEPLIETCQPMVLLDAGNEGHSYKWSDNSTNQYLSVSITGYYSVEVVSDNGCSSTGATSVTILESAAVDLGLDIEACGDTLLRAGVNAASYLWSTAESSESIMVGESGEVWVEVISEDLCIVRDTVNVVIHQLPYFDLGEDQHLCDGQTYTLDATSSIGHVYTWLDGSASQKFLATKTGNYTAKVTSKEGCTFTDQVLLSFHPLPVLPLSANYESCGEIVISALNPGSSFFWSTGETDQKISLVESGDYWTRVTSDKGCISIDSTSVVVHPLPAPLLGENHEICFGATVDLDPGPFEVYEWTGGYKDRVVTVDLPGTYHVTVTDEFGCKNTDTVTVVVRPSLGLELGPDKVLCSPGNFLLDAGVDEVRYHWTSSAGLKSSEKKIIANKPGVYEVTISDEFGCTQFDKIALLETTEKVEASFLMPSVAGVGELVHFVQLTDPEPLSSLWSFGNNFTSTQNSPTYRYFEDREYIVSLTVSNGVCTDSETKTLHITNKAVQVDTLDKKELFEVHKAAVYPNPATDALKLELELSHEANVVIILYNLSGFPLAEYSFIGKEQSVDIDVSVLLPGTYIMVLQAGHTIKTIRFVKS